MNEQQQAGEVPSCAKTPRATRNAVDTWCIWTKNGRRPSFFHPSREQAEAEAARLAAKQPGKKFLVMQVVSKISVPGIDDLARAATEEGK